MLNQQQRLQGPKTACAMEAPFALSYGPLYLHQRLSAGGGVAGVEFVARLARVGPSAARKPVRSTM